MKEGMVSSLKKTKFGRKTTKDMELMSSVDDVMDLEALMIGEIPISLFYRFSNIANYFEVKKDRRRPNGGRRKAPDHKGRCELWWSYHRIL